MKERRRATKDERFESLLKDCAKNKPEQSKAYMQELLEDLQEEDLMEELSEEEAKRALELCRKSILNERM